MVNVRQCDGDKSQVCGGALRLSVYQQGTASAAGAVRVPWTLGGALLFGATMVLYGLS